MVRNIFFFKQGASVSRFLAGPFFFLEKAPFLKAGGVFVAVPGRGLFFFQEKTTFFKSRGVFVAVPGRGFVFPGKKQKKTFF